jgi:hypothetical protein
MPHVIKDKKNIYIKNWIGKKQWKKIPTLKNY